MGLYSRYVFPRLMDWSMRRESIRGQRRETLQGLSGRVLEIGFGTGLNLPHYPDEVRLLEAVDVNPGMSRLARQRLQETSLKVQHHSLDGERLPMSEASFDCAVSTWTLCSIADVEAALGEIYRVLKPGGRFVFIEHGLSPEAGVARWQRRLTPLQRLVGDGCRLDRDIAALLASAGFEEEEMHRYYFQDAPRILGYFYRGAVCKPVRRDRAPATREP
ncbi:MAG TPA: class I SAM-dependent methyltransferase [Acidobacteriota bacterium]|nr:class I SAM-dependent methyltransferase [Acidobacteriota bacterium]